MNEDFVRRTVERASGFVAYDIGANHGTYTGLLAKRFSAVYAFEPHEANLVHLRKNCEGLDNVTIVPKAISNISGTGLLYVSESNGGGHSISKKVAARHNWGHSLDRHIEIEHITIDDFSMGNSFIPQFIKMDIEGGEDIVWDGAVKTLQDAKPDIILEVHQCVDLKHLFSLFTGYGYNWYDHENKRCSELHKDEHYFLTVKPF